MNRRLFLSLGLATLLAGQTAYADDFATSVVDQLRRQGFSKISIARTLLGRTQIVALGKKGRREIILNPRTGEILRDLWVNGSGYQGGLLEDDRSGKGRGRSGSDDGSTDNGDDSNDDGDNNSGGDDDSNDDGDDNSGSDDDSNDDGDNSGSGSDGDSGGSDDND